MSHRTITYKGHKVDIYGAHPREGGIIEADGHDANDNETGDLVENWVNDKERPFKNDSEMVRMICDYYQAKGVTICQLIVD